MDWRERFANKSCMPTSGDRETWEFPRRPVTYLALKRMIDALRDEAFDNVAGTEVDRMRVVRALDIGAGAILADPEKIRCVEDRIESVLAEIKEARRQTVKRET